MIKQSRGFSLIEIVIVIMLTGIVSGFIGLFLSQGFTTYFATKPIINIASKANIAMDNVLREVKSAQSINAASATSLIFVNQEGQTVVIDRVGTTLRRNVDSTGAQPLCTNVTAFTFSYFNVALATTATAANVRYIAVAMTVSDGNIPYSITSGTLVRKLL